MSSLDSVILETGPNPKACIVWLHGLGADGYDFVPITRELALPFAVRYLFPHAPIQAVTINGGQRMRAWYDIASPNLIEQVDKVGIRRAQGWITALLEAQVTQGISPDRLVLGGFSQGGVMALEVGARYKPSLAGLVALSAYLAVPEEFPEASPNSPPILMVHGSQDPIVPLALAEHSRRVLERKAYRVSFQIFPMGHAVCAEEVALLERWLKARLA